MFEVGKFYELQCGEIGECIQNTDGGITHPVTLLFKDSDCIRTYTSSGHYFGERHTHEFDIVKEVKKEVVNIKALKKRIMDCIDEFIDEELERRTCSK